MKKQNQKKQITEAMLMENPEFVQKVVKSSKQPTKTMTVDQFQDWLNKI